MKVDAGKAQLLTIAAILVLISGGIAAYAENQYSAATGSPLAANNASQNGSSKGQGSKVSFDNQDTTTTFSTTSTTSTLTGPAQLCTPPARPGHPGRIVLPITPANQTAQGGVTFADGKGCVATITTVGGIFSVQVVLKFAKPVTQYNVVLVANGTNYPLGNMVTGPGGSGQMQNQVLLTTGTWVVSLKIFDVSTTPGTSTLVLQTGQGTIVSPPFPTPGSNGQGRSQGGDNGDSDSGS